MTDERTLAHIAGDGELGTDDDPDEILTDDISLRWIGELHIEMNYRESRALLYCVRQYRNKLARNVARSTFVPEPGKRNAAVFALERMVALYDRLLAAHKAAFPKSSKPEPEETAP